VEKLRKPLEKKAAVSAAQKTKNTGCVNRKVLLRYWRPTRDQNNASGDKETNYGRARQMEDGKVQHG